jgi:RNase P/RNase MRP subunit POP5
LLKRVKRRYLALQIDSDCEFGQKGFMDSVWRAVSQLYGEYGASRTSLALINYDEKRKTSILRTSLETVDIVRAALATITQIDGKEAAVHVLAISGTIKALCKKTKF